MLAVAVMLGATATPAMAQSKKPPLSPEAGIAVAMYLQGWAVGDYIKSLEPPPQVQEQQEAPTPTQEVVAAEPTVVGSCGGATNGADAYIVRESGGDPTAMNPSGAWGCYQIMPDTWASSCSDLGNEQSADPSTQAACASRLPLSAWGG